MERVVAILVQQWEYDVAVMSQPWMYWCLLVPIAVYVVFFLAKWMVLTAPAWLPLFILFRAIRER